jgi:hypothetical protein
LHSQEVIVSATYQKGVTSFDTGTSSHEGADLYSLRAASKPTGCHGPPSATAQLTANWPTTYLLDYSPSPHGAAVWGSPHRADALRFPFQSSVTSQQPKFGHETKSRLIHHYIVRLKTINIVCVYCDYHYEQPHSIPQVQGCFGICKFSKNRCR